jgi:beta-lactamase superfamily II metal-dependent hydrolase
MRRQLNKYFSFAVVVAVLVGVLVWSTVYRQAGASVTSGNCKISFLDVGQGDSTLISLPGSVEVLIDGGRDSEAVSQVEKNMPPFDNKIEYVIATHPDSDHIGGLPQVLQNYKVGEFIQTDKKGDSQTYSKLEDLIKQKNIPVHEVQKGEIISFSALASAKVLWPDEKQIDSLSSNDSSVVLRFACGSSYVILTGDAQTEAQDSIAKENTEDDLAAQIFHTAHHGAKNGFSENLVDKVKPETAIVSVGPNSYGHPSSFTLNELGKLSIKTYRTDKNGTLSFVSNGQAWQGPK